ncbi:Rid family hydrolase [Marmoricola sp. RAF53]|uniref:Rid family hydrolase n=1 Tax=Marmoricola sp. RAF53 TaxID=3233059 RepID=UPI003F99BCCC
MAEAADWNAVMGFKPVVRRGPLVAVSGVGGARDHDGEAVPGGAYAQTRAALEKVRRSLASVGAGPEHVVRTRVFLRAIGDWPEAGRAHGEFFESGEVALTMVEARLVDPAMLVELDAEAWVTVD